MRGRGWVLAVALAFASGCGGDGPSGPGTLDATVQSSVEIGAAVIQLNGVGIGSVTGVGSTQAFGPDATASSKRVVLVSPGGTLRFEIGVEDVGSPTPTATVVEAVGTDNEPITALGGIVVSVAGN